LIVGVAIGHLSRQVRNKGRVAAQRVEEDRADSAYDRFVFLTAPLVAETRLVRDGVKHLVQKGVGFLVGGLVGVDVDEQASEISVAHKV
jgi:hypothetical protein